MSQETEAYAAALKRLEAAQGAYMRESKNPDRTVESMQKAFDEHEAAGRLIKDLTTRFGRK